MRALPIILLTLGCGEVVVQKAVSKTLPFEARPLKAELGRMVAVQLVARWEGQPPVREIFEYTEVIREVTDGRATKVERDPPDGIEGVDFEQFEALLPGRGGRDVPTTWTKTGVLGSLAPLISADCWDRNGGTAECTFEEIVIQGGRSEAWVAVRFRGKLQDREIELTGRMKYDLKHRMLTDVELKGAGLTLTATRRRTTVK